MAAYVLTIVQSLFSSAVNANNGMNNGVDEAHNGIIFCKLLKHIRPVRTHIFCHHNIFSTTGPQNSTRLRIRRLSPAPAPAPTSSITSSPSPKLLVRWLRPHASAPAARLLPPPPPSQIPVETTLRAEKSKKGLNQIPMPENTEQRRTSHQVHQTKWSRETKNSTEKLILRFGVRSANKPSKRLKNTRSTLRKDQPIFIVRSAKLSLSSTTSLVSARASEIIIVRSTAPDVTITPRPSKNTILTSRPHRATSAANVATTSSSSGMALASIYTTKSVTIRCLAGVVATTPQPLKNTKLTSRPRHFTFAVDIAMTLSRYLAHTCFAYTTKSVTLRCTAPVVIGFSRRWKNAVFTSRPHCFTSAAKLAMTLSTFRMSPVCVNTTGTATLCCPAPLVTITSQPLPSYPLICKKLITPAMAARNIFPNPRTSSITA